MNHDWKPVEVLSLLTGQGETFWVCRNCEASFKGHWEMGQGAIENFRIRSGILENCKEEQIKRIMYL